MEEEIEELKETIKGLEEDLNEAGRIIDEMRGLGYKIYKK